MSDDSSWPPRVRESHQPDRPRTEAPPASSSAPAQPGTPESIGAVDHEETQVEEPQVEEPREEPRVEEPRVDRRAAKRVERAQRRVERAQQRADRRQGDDEDEYGTEPRDRRRLINGLLIGGLVLMTALATTFFTLWLLNSDVEPKDVQSYLDEQRPEIEERARTAIDILINYDSTNIDERRTEMLSVSTGSFRDDYEEFTQSLGDVLEEAGASSSGAILDEPRISYTSPDEADVVVRTEQIAQTQENPTGRKIEYIMRLGLIDTQGGWKVDNIEILSDEVT